MISWIVTPELDGDAYGSAVNFFRNCYCEENNGYSISVTVKIYSRGHNLL